MRRGKPMIRAALSGRPAGRGNVAAGCGDKAWRRCRGYVEKTPLLVGMVVGGVRMVRMVVVMGAVLAGMIVVVGHGVRAVVVGVLVLVGVLVGVGVVVGMGMLSDPGMLVFVGVFVGVLMDVLVAVLVISLHGDSSWLSFVSGSAGLGARPDRFTCGLWGGVLGKPGRVRCPARVPDPAHCLEEKITNCICM